jgi:hypothetical protein
MHAPVRHGFPPARFVQRLCLLQNGETRHNKLDQFPVEDGELAARTSSCTYYTRPRSFCRPPFRVYTNPVPAKEVSVYRYFLPFFLVFALACAAVPAHAQQAKRIWTNADMDDLRDQGLISIVGSEVEAAPAAAPAPVEFPIYASSTEDPAWYAQQAADLQMQLVAGTSGLAQAQDSLLQARDGRGTTGSFNMAAGDTYGVTPEERIAFLESQVQETQARLDELADLARRNDILPGVLRGTPA